MIALIAGLIVFFAPHLVPWFPGARSALIVRLGARSYRAAFALTAFAGLALIVIGKINAPFVPLYTPPAWGALLAQPLVLAAFLILPGAYLPSNIKRFTRHPMLWGVTLWAIAHLLANGDRASVLLFGAFALYSLADMASANARGASRSSKRYPWTQDLKVAIAGAVAYAIVFALHPYLFGVRPG